jgi:hypothetical protein
MMPHDISQPSFNHVDIAALETIPEFDGCDLLYRSWYRWLFGPLATYRFFPHPKIVFATTRLDYLKSSCICSLLLEDIINLVASRSDCIVVL